jgi:phenylalanyl-tRNA synthetase alpha chain
MLAQAEQLHQEALARLETAESTTALESWYRDTLGRKGSVYLLTRQIGQVDPADRPAFGKRINEIKTVLETAYEARLAKLRATELEAELAGSAIDVTLPGRKMWHGRLHPATQTLRDIYRIWGDMGFQIYRSRDVETDHYNFELLNIPQHHPARDMWDTFHTVTPGVICAPTPAPARFTPCTTTVPNQFGSFCPACATVTSKLPPAAKSNSTK